MFLLLFKVILLGALFTFMSAIANKKYLIRILWIIPFVFTIHNLEEALFFNLFLERMKALPPVNFINPSIFYHALWSITLIGITINVFTLIHASKPWVLKVVLVIISGLFFNALIHISQAVVLGHYVPGAATAILLFLPLAYFVFRWAYKNGLLEKRKFPSILLMGLLLNPIGIGLAWAIGILLT